MSVGELIRELEWIKTK